MKKIVFSGKTARCSFFFLMIISSFWYSAPPLLATGAIKIEDNDEDDIDLQLALHRSRKLQQIESLKTINDKVIGNHRPYSN